MPNSPTSREDEEKERKAKESEDFWEALVNLLNPMGPPIFGFNPGALINVGCGCIMGLFICLGLGWVATQSKQAISQSQEKIDNTTGLYEVAMPDTPPIYVSYSQVECPDRRSLIDPDWRGRISVTENLFIERNKENDFLIISSGEEAVVIYWNISTTSMEATYYNRMVSNSFGSYPAKTGLHISADSQSFVVCYKGGFYVWISE